MIEATCPHCMHVVTAETPGSARCPNCGAQVAVRKVGAATPPVAPATPRAASIPRQVPEAAAPGSPPVTPGAAMPTPERPLRTASLLTLIFGLLVIVPFVTQVIALICGAVALGRRRKPNERVAGAWFGIVLALLALAGWGVACRWSLGLRNRPGGFFPMPYAGVTTAEESDDLSVLAIQEAMTLVEAACRDYRRDFNRWPASIDTLRGNYLPAQYTLPRGVTLHAGPPDPARDDGRWVLLSSQPITSSLDGEPLAAPHRLIIRPGGKVELVTAREADELLAGQPAPPPSPEDSP